MRHQTMPDLYLRRRDFLHPVQNPEFSDPIVALFGYRRLAVIDTEYTGLIPFEVAVTTFGLQRGAPPGFGFPDAWVIDPEVKLNPMVAKATGATDGQLSGAGNFAVHAPRLMRYLQQSESAYLIGWNVGGDKNVIERSLARNRLSYGPMHWIDLARMFWKLHPEVGANPGRICSLSEAAEFYGIPLAGTPHLAFYDVLTTCKVLSAVCAEWVALDFGIHNVEVKGFYGSGWDPRAIDLPVAPITWRALGEPAESLAAELEIHFQLRHGRK